MERGYERMGPNPLPNFVDLGHGDILEAVAARYGVLPYDLKGPSQHRRHVDPRHIAMYILRLQHHSFPDIGRMFSRDHTSAFHANRRVAAWLKKSTDLFQVVENCIKDAQVLKATRLERQRERKATGGNRPFLTPTG